jgi:hypothetical protein
MLASTHPQAACQAMVHVCHSPSSPVSRTSLIHLCHSALLFVHARSSLLLWLKKGTTQQFDAILVARSLVFSSLLCSDYFTFTRFQYYSYFTVSNDTSLFILHPHSSLVLLPSRIDPRHRITLNALHSVYTPITTLPQHSYTFHR